MEIKAWMIKEDFNPKYNVLYFGDKYDFRLIPKNCSTTAKVLWSVLEGHKIKVKEGNPHGTIPNNEATLSYRKKKVLGNNNKTFRAGCKKVAVSRDPIERWVSAINFCVIMKEYNDNNGEYQQYSSAEWVDWDINMIASYQLGHGFMVSELLPQSYCAGGVDKYDHVYTKKTFDEFVSLLEQEFDIELPRVQSTKTEGQGKWAVSDLNDDAIAILKHIYSKDYELGWTG